MKTFTIGWCLEKLHRLRKRQCKIVNKGNHVHLSMLIMNHTFARPYVTSFTPHIATNRSQISEHGHVNLNELSTVGIFIG